MCAFLILSIVPAARASLYADEAWDTADPLRAFVFEEYARGDDYFIRGTRDTVLFRCTADFNHDGRPDVALSEKSIWGNRTGPFEIFVQEPNGRFRYWRTADYESELKADCGKTLESCLSNGYLTSGQCSWTRGWQ
jgi:hypothetical protein